MKKLLLLTVFLTFTAFSVNAQNFDVPPNPKAGKCYERCFKYDKRFEWKEVDCSKIKEQNTKMTVAQLSKIEEEKQKMQQYQQQLKALGYLSLIHI